MRTKVVAGSALVLVLLYGVHHSYAQDVVMEPERRFGTGSVYCTEMFPDEQKLLTAGSAGAFLWDIGEKGFFRVRVDE